MAGVATAVGAAAGVVLQPGATSDATRNAAGGRRMVIVREELRSRKAAVLTASLG
jgi:hypothetical protein